MSFFDLGDCIKIIECKKNWGFFDPIFIGGNMDF